MIKKTFEIIDYFVDKKYSEYKWEGISISKRYYWKKIRVVLIVLAFAITWFLLMLAITSNRNGNMTIYVDNTKATRTLSLSESATLSNPTGKLNGPALVNGWDEVVDNIPSYSDLLDGNSSVNEGKPEDPDAAVRTTKNYIAYTFYLFNSGSEKLNYTMSFNIDSVEKDLDSTIRVRIYEDGQETTYAKTKSNGEAEDRTTPFSEEDVIVYKEYKDFEVGQVRKYSIVIWIDAEDLDTTNEKIGGALSLSMHFKVVD